MSSTNINTITEQNTWISSSGYEISATTSFVYDLVINNSATDGDMIFKNTTIALLQNVTVSYIRIYDSAVVYLKNISAYKIEIHDSAKLYILGDGITETMYFYAYNYSQSQIQDANIDYIFAFGNSNITIHNSTITHICPYDNTRIHIFNSTMYDVTAKVISSEKIPNVFIDSSNVHIANYYKVLSGGSGSIYNDTITFSGEIFDTITFDSSTVNYSEMCGFAIIGSAVTLEEISPESYHYLQFIHLFNSSAIISNLTRSISLYSYESDISLTGAFAACLHADNSEIVAEKATWDSFTNEISDSKLIVVNSTLFKVSLSSTNATFENTSITFIYPQTGSKSFFNGTKISYLQGYPNIEATIYNSTVDTMYLQYISSSTQIILNETKVSTIYGWINVTNDLGIVSGKIYGDPSNYEIVGITNISSTLEDLVPKIVSIYGGKVNISDTRLDKAEVYSGNVQFRNYVDRVIAYGGIITLVDCTAPSYYYISNAQVSFTNFKKTEIPWVDFVGRFENATIFAEDSEFAYMDIFNSELFGENVTITKSLSVENTTVYLNNSEINWYFNYRYSDGASLVNCTINVLYDDYYFSASGEIINNVASGGVWHANYLLQNTVFDNVYIMVTVEGADLSVFNSTIYELIANDANLDINDSKIVTSVTLRGISEARIYNHTVINKLYMYDSSKAYIHYSNITENIVLWGDAQLIYSKQESDTADLEISLHEQSKANISDILLRCIYFDDNSSSYISNITVNEMEVKYMAEVSIKDSQIKTISSSAFSKFNMTDSEINEFRIIIEPEDYLKGLLLGDLWFKNITTGVHINNSLDLLIGTNLFAVNNTTYSGVIDRFPQGNYEYVNLQYSILLTEDALGTIDNLIGADISIFAGIIHDSFAPILTSIPDDIAFENGTTGHTLSWIAQDAHPGYYFIFINGTLALDPYLHNPKWESGSPIVYNVDSLGIGTHNITIIIADLFGNSISDSAMVTISPKSITGGLDTTTIIIIAAVIGIITGVVVILYWKKRKK